MDALSQRYQIAKRDILCSLTCFFYKPAVDEVNGFDVRIRNIEDWPIKMRILDQGYKMEMMNEYTVLYRIGNSVSAGNDVMFRSEHIKLLKKVKKLYCYPVVRGNIKYRWNDFVTELRYYIIIKTFKNKRSSFNYVLNILLSLLNTEKIKKAVLNTIFNKRAKKEVQIVCKKMMTRFE